MSDIRQVAKQYIENGWSVVPLNPGEKRVTDSAVINALSNLQPLLVR
jgi:hypothetical protein